MMQFKQWLLTQEMWFSPEEKVQKNRRKHNKNLEGTQIPQYSLGPRPAATQGGCNNAYPSAMKKK
jgi:hypothetical protein